MQMRAAKLSDIDGLMALGIEAMEKDPYEGLVMDRKKMRNMLVECISGASNFCWLVEDDEGAPQAAVTVLVHPMMFYERNQASVVQFYSRVPGWGVKLIREFLKWARGRRAIKMIVFTLEPGADPRIGRLLERLGLRQALPVYMETR